MARGGGLGRWVGGWVGGSAGAAGASRLRGRDGRPSAAPDPPPTVVPRRQQKSRPFVIFSGRQGSQKLSVTGRDAHLLGAVCHAGPIPPHAPPPTPWF